MYSPKSLLLVIACTLFALAHAEQPVVSIMWTAEPIAQSQNDTCWLLLPRTSYQGYGDDYFPSALIEVDAQSIDIVPRVSYQNLRGYYLQNTTWAIHAKCVVVDVDNNNTIMYGFACIWQQYFTYHSVLHDDSNRVATKTPLNSEWTSASFEAPEHQVSAEGTFTVEACAPSFSVDTGTIYSIPSTIDGSYAAGQCAELTLVFHDTVVPVDIILLDSSNTIVTTLDEYNAGILYHTIQMQAVAPFLDETCGFLRGYNGSFAQIVTSLGTTYNTSGGSQINIPLNMSTSNEDFDIILDIYACSIQNEDPVERVPPSVILDTDINLGYYITAWDYYSALGTFNDRFGPRANLSDTDPDGIGAGPPLSMGTSIYYGNALSLEMVYSEWNDTTTGPWIEEYPPVLDANVFDLWLNIPARLAIIDFNTAVITYVSWSAALMTNDGFSYYAVPITNASEIFTLDSYGYDECSFPYLIPRPNPVAIFERCEHWKSGQFDKLTFNLASDSTSTTHVRFGDEVFLRPFEAKTSCCSIIKRQDPSHIRQYVCTQECNFIARDSSTRGTFFFENNAGIGTNVTCSAFDGYETISTTNGVKSCPTPINAIHYYSVEQSAQILSPYKYNFSGVTSWSEGLRILGKSRPIGATLRMGDVFRLVTAQTYTIYPNAVEVNGTTMPTLLSALRCTFRIPPVRLPNDNSILTDYIHQNGPSCSYIDSVQAIIQQYMTLWASEHDIEEDVLLDEATSAPIEFVDADTQDDVVINGIPIKWPTCVTKRVTLHVKRYPIHRLTCPVSAVTAWVMKNATIATMVGLNSTLCGSALGITDSEGYEDIVTWEWSPLSGGGGSLYGDCQFPSSSGQWNITVTGRTNNTCSMTLTIFSLDVLESDLTALDNASNALVFPLSTDTERYVCIPVEIIGQNTHYIIPDSDSTVVRWCGRYLFPENQVYRIYYFVGNADDGYTTSYGLVMVNATRSFDSRDTLELLDSTFQITHDGDPLTNYVTVTIYDTNTTYYMSLQTSTGEPAITGVPWHYIYIDDVTVWSSDNGTITFYLTEGFHLIEHIVCDSNTINLGIYELCSDAGLKMVAIIGEVNFAPVLVAQPAKLLKYRYAIPGSSYTTVVARDIEDDELTPPSQLFSYYTINEGSLGLVVEYTGGDNIYHLQIPWVITDSKSHQAVATLHFTVEDSYGAQGNATVLLTIIKEHDDHVGWIFDLLTGILHIGVSLIGVVVLFTLGCYICRSIEKQEENPENSQSTGFSIVKIISKGM